MTDPILHDFLERQYNDGMALAGSSDIFELMPMDGTPPDRYITKFNCTGLIKDEDEVQTFNCFAVGISFPSDYLRRSPNPARILTWLGPGLVWHPNITPPIICVGPIPCGTTLVELVYQVFEIITYQKFTPREDDALNHQACAWARRNQQQFPLDTRPLKRRPLQIEAEPVEERDQP